MTTSKNGKVTSFASSVDTTTSAFRLDAAVGNIDDEYIRRYIGQLDPLEESCLVQLRQWVADTHKGKVRIVREKASARTSFLRVQLPNDSHLLRFLRARRFDIEKARENICHSLAW